LNLPNVGQRSQSRVFSPIKGGRILFQNQNILDNSFIQSDQKIMMASGKPPITNGVNVVTFLKTIFSYFKLILRKSNLFYTNK